MVRACIVPGCRSGSEVPSHAFPKSIDRLRKWLAVVKSPRLNNLTIEEIKKFTVCYKHFPEGSYIATLQRRRLKHTAIPSLNLPSSMDPIDPSGASNININPEDVLKSLKEDIQLGSSSLSKKTQPGTSIVQKQYQPNLSNLQERPEHFPDIIQAEDQPSPSNCEETAEAQNQVDGSTIPTQNSALTDGNEKNVLETTKKPNSTQKRKWLNEVVQVKKAKSTEGQKTASYKQRLRDAQKFCQSVYFKKLKKSFSRTQKLFSEMKQCKTKHAQNLELAKLCNNICRVCPEYAHEYLGNLFNK